MAMWRFQQFQALRQEADDLRQALEDRKVIERAKEADIPLYMLGLGRRQEINEKVMIRMAEETKGKYYHAGSEAALIKLFEQLSIDLHDDGIAEDVDHRRQCHPERRQGNLEGGAEPSWPRTPPPSTPIVGFSSSCA